MRRTISLLFAIAAIVGLTIPLASTVHAQDRVALVIGNDRYPNLPADKQLQTAVNDARAIGDALRNIGFKVISGENLNRAGMVDRIFAFTQAIKPGDTAVVFFAGHGVALAGGNYLLPTDVPLPREGEEARARNMALGEADIISDIQEKKPRVAVLMLDACRNNPFQRPGLTRSIGGERGLTRGREAEGVFSVYSAGFGQEALDRLGPNDPSPNSVFTRVLVPQLARRDIHLGDIIIDVREEVAKLAASVNHPQYPAYYDQTRGGRVYLAARSIAVEPAPRASAGRRLALVIGNSGYVHVEKPKNPGNDAAAVARMLRDAKFDVVLTMTDLDRKRLLATLKDFAAEAERADVAVIYFAGHGTRIGVDRFVFAIDTKPGDQLAAAVGGVHLNELINSTRGAKTLRFVVVDAAQFPLDGAMTERSIETSSAIVLYSAGPNEPVMDGSGSLSPFAQAFIQRFRPPGIAMKEAFAQLQSDVSMATNKAQTPVIYGDLPAQLSLVAR